MDFTCYHRAHPKRTINDLEDAWHQQPVAMLNGSTHEHMLNMVMRLWVMSWMTNCCLSIDTQFVKCYANFILRMQEKHLIPVSTVQSILGDVFRMFEMAGAHQKHRMKEVLAKHNLSAMVGSEILNALDNGVLEVAKGKLSTDWKRRKFYREHLHFVEPENYMLGRNAKGQLRPYQNVPLLENLIVLMKHDDVLSAILHPPANIPEVLCDYRNGDHFKNNRLFQEHSDALQLFFYFEEFEVANPRGYAKTKHKLGGIYYILGNLPPNKRNAWHTIQLAMLVSVPDIKEFGFKIYS